MRAARAAFWLRATPRSFRHGMGRQPLHPLLSLYRDVGHYSELRVDLFLATYVLGLIPGLLISGPLSDRYGRMPMTVIGVIVCISASLILVVSFRSEALMCAGRMLAGAGVGISMAGLTGAFYSLGYLGFLLPVALAGLASLASYTVLLGIVVLACLASLAVVSAGLRRTTP